MALSIIKTFFLTMMAALLAGSMPTLSAKAADTVSLGSLDVSKVQQGWGRPQVDKSVEGNTAFHRR